MGSNEDKTCFSLKIALAVAFWLLVFAGAIELLGMLLSQPGAGNPVLATIDLTRYDLWMIVVGGCCFIAFWGFSERYIFAPYMSLFRAREAATTEAESSAGAVKTRADNLNRDYEEQLKEGRVEAMRAKLEKIAEAKREADQIISEAEGKAQQHALRTREILAEKREQLRQAAFAEIDSMVSEVSTKLMQPEKQVRRTVH